MSPWLPDLPRLEDDVVELEPLRVGHAEIMAKVLGDPSSYEYMGGTPPTLDALRSRYERQVRGRSLDGSQLWLNWVVLHRASGDALGYVQATVSGGPNGFQAELAWVIGVTFQGRGFAKAAAGLVKRWLCVQGVQALVAHIHPDHLASGGVAASLGLTPTGLSEGGETIWVGAC